VPVPDEQLLDKKSYFTCKNAKQKLVALHPIDAEILGFLKTGISTLRIPSIMTDLELRGLANMLLCQDNKSHIIMTTTDSKYKTLNT
jgi:hypothetical protein